MPLVAAQLISGIAGVFKSLPSSGAEAADGIASEYDSYCKVASAPPGLPVFTGAERTAFMGTLAPALASADAGDPNIVASAFSNALMAYWMSPPVVFSAGAVNGLVTAVSGAPAIILPIATGLKNTNNTAESIAAIIGAQLDTATRTVLVTFSTPPPPTGPPPPAMVM